MSSPEGYRPDVDLAVELQWSDYDTGLFTQKLYRHVKNNEVSFELEAEPGSVLTSFGVAVTSGVTVAVITGIGRYLWKRHQAATDRGRDFPNPTVLVFIEGQKYEITVQDEEDVREIERLANLKAEEERDDGQQSMDDY